jgi:transposase InsO family protein
MTEQGLREIYHNPVSGYQSAEKLYRRAKEDGLKVTRKSVNEWLLTQDTYTRYKPIVRKHKFQKTYVKELGEQVQMDLVDMGKYKSKNGGYYWILTAIDILSRYAFAIPVYRKDTKNMTKAVGTLLDQFSERFGKYPDVAQFDDGKEFYNVGVKDLLSDHGVSYFSTNSSRKAAVVERFNRTLRSAMEKYFYSKGTHNWVGVLDDLVTNYNGTKHSTILMKPADVSRSNQWMVWNTLFDHEFGELPMPKYRVDDQVRISRYKSTFAKGYDANFTEEIFKISKVFRWDPTMYELTDHTGEPIVGKFYEEELSLVDATDHEYRVEKILKRRKGQVLVKWLGYGAQHNSWIPEKSITAIE